MLAAAINTSIKEEEMRVSEFTHQSDMETVEQQPLKVVVENGVRLAVVPFQARVLCPVDPDRYSRFTTAVTVTMAGMTIGDAEVKPRHYTRDEQFIVADLTGTLPVFTRVGIQDAICRAKASEIDIAGQWMVSVRARPRIVNLRCLPSSTGATYRSC